MRSIGNLFVICRVLLLLGTTTHAQTIAADATPGRLILAQTFCPEVEMPVCGTKDGKRIRYGNACKAKRDGATDITPGGCGTAR